MFTEEDYVSLETAKLLKEKGFDEVCRQSYLHHCRVRDEIYEKYPGLSDDGYRDLVYVDGLSKEEVYGYYDEIVDFTGCNKPSWAEYANYFIASAPTLYESQKWIWERHKMFVSAAPQPPFANPLEFFFWIDFPEETIDNYGSRIIEKHFSSFQQALDAGIQEALKLI